MYVWTNKFVHSEAKKEGGARVKTGAIIGTNTVFILCSHIHPMVLGYPINGYIK